ncbi:LacI family transcriptional regulator [Occultella glacieicola]|uniref:LacI family transcriptional regulator n=1 Tax=Occultella glacieicola TaxID=2518684 RepID=A0ABY2DXC7_9MICO|nr:LacI family DNA-binding transcriptional regulator [Occultella glacieicola]TDE88790.1 LacI family transcriptional regulator [Occultella glacieicola]
MSQPTRRPTIREVAKHAGVSHQTVSRFLRDDPTLRPQTRKAVEDAVGALGYRPNLAARSMRTRRSGAVAIVLPTMTGPERTVAAAVEEARSSGFRVEVIIGVDESAAALSARARDLLDSGQVEGVLSVAPIVAATDRAGAVIDTGEYDQRMRAVEAVAGDVETMASLVRALADLGHRHLLHAAGPQGWNSAQLRLRGYLRAIEELGLTSHGEPAGDWHPETGIKAMATLDDDSPVTAVVAASDRIAAGVLSAAADRGWAVPDRISVTGWDDMLLMRYATPPLSTVVVDRETAGRHAMRRLIAAVRGEAEPPAPETTLTRVTLRGSSGPPPRR